MESQRENAILRKIYSPIKMISIEKGSLYSYCSCSLNGFLHVQWVALGVIDPLPECIIIGFQRI